MSKSESLDGLLNASLRVSRPVAACSRCRGAKIKCDGKLPACTACERSGKSDSCSGANDDFAKGKERSYVAALESACERLQKRITKVNTGGIQRPGSLGIESESGPPQESELVKPASVREFMGGRRQLSREATDVDDLVGDFGYLSVNATARDFHGFSSFAKLMLFSCQKQALPVFERNSLPARYATVSLTQHYLDNIFTLFPFFSETTFMASLSLVYSEDGRFARPYDHFILRMVLAISAASKSRRSVDQNAIDSVRHASAAIGLAETAINPGSIAGVQALLLLTQYSLFDPVHFSCWDLVGVASRVMVDLGIHQEPAADLRISKDELEMRRRVFYCVFALDRLISMSFSRAFSFTDDSTIVELPTASTATSTNNPYAGASLFLRPLNPSYYLFTIRILQSRFYHGRYFASRDTLQPEVAQLEAVQLATEACTWFYQAQSALPLQQSSSLTLLFRLEMLYTQVLALSASPRAPFIGDHNKTILVTIAADYLLNLAPAIDDPNWHAFLSYVDVLRVCYVAKSMLNALQSCYETVLNGFSSSPAPAVQLPPVDVVNLPSHDVLTNTSRILSSLEAAVQIMIWSERRWGQLDARPGLDNDVLAMITKLKLKQSQVLGQNPMQPGQDPSVYRNCTQAMAIRPVMSGAPIPHLTVDTQSYVRSHPQELSRRSGAFDSHKTV